MSLFRRRYWALGAAKNWSNQMNENKTTLRDSGAPVVDQAAGVGAEDWAPRPSDEAFTVMRDGCFKDWEDFARFLFVANKEHQAIARQNEKLRADLARLDWFDSTQWKGERFESTIWLQPTLEKWNTVRHPNIRAAIDAAMGAEAKVKDRPDTCPECDAMKGQP